MNAQRQKENVLVRALKRLKRNTHTQVRSARSQKKKPFEVVARKWQYFLGARLHYQWLGALALAVASCSLLAFTGMRGCLAAVIIVATLCFAAAVSLLIPVSRHRRSLQRPIDRLIATIDRYCAQINSRTFQRPWLLASMAAYISAFLLFVFTHSDGDTAWFRTGLATTIGIVCMSMAGYFAEENPPVKGARGVLRILRGYKAVCRSEHEMLMWKIYQGTWRMEDLVAFATVEQQEHDRLALAEQQNEVFKEPG